MEQRWLPFDNLQSRATIKRMLRDGAQPHQLPGAKTIGCGIDRMAYRVGPYVVKRANPIAERDFRGIRDGAGRLVIRRAPTAIVNGLNIYGEPTRWEIQPYYGELVGSDNESWNTIYGGFDLHGGNVAQDRRGRLVAFDWGLLLPLMLFGSMVV